MSNFSVEPFKNEDGTPDPNKFVLKLKRGSLHPGVISRFIGEALDVKETPEGSFNYVRGALTHMWTLELAQFELLKAHMGKFDATTLQTHLADLRKEFPKVAYKPSPAAAILDAIASSEDEDESEDEEEE